MSKIQRRFRKIQYVYHPSVADMRLRNSIYACRSGAQHFTLKPAGTVVDCELGEVTHSQVGMTR